MPTNDEHPKFYENGQFLYGDDFSPEEIEAWYTDERIGYYNLATNYEKQSYPYRVLNHWHFFRGLRNKFFPTCLVYGPGDGSDVLPISRNVGRFICIEPARNWWKTSIGTAPAEYYEPNVDGSLPIQDGIINLVVIFGVLHHIPNVTSVLKEIRRVTSSRAILLLREPIHSLGDWREPRPGLTKRERGLPLPWLMKSLAALNFSIRYKQLCMFAPLHRCASLLHVNIYNNLPLVIIDEIFSSMFSWNLHYWRDTFLKKIAPSSIAIVAEKTFEDA